MIEQKSHDWILNVMQNPNLSTADLKAAGLNTDNTSLLSEDIYKQSNKITENPIFKDENGMFDETKFHQFYENAQLTYNLLANDTYLDKEIEFQTKYGLDNIFAPKGSQKIKPVQYTLTPNPDRQTQSIIRIGQLDEPKNGVSEIGQTQLVLNNPTEVYDEEGNPDWSKADWHVSPNDSWTTDFFDTRVLATYDSDGQHIDPLTGELVEHFKGQPRLNENGTYYYENLDGRDIYGKQVLNKMNTLTTDGSFWNQYDFFDSDDIKQKSIGGSVMKNAVLVGSMFIPYIGPYIAAASVATQLVGIFGTLGKMIPGLDNDEIFSYMEGWSKSVNRQTAKTQYAQENTWCWENFINLIGDVAGQLKEQRFLFEYAPGIIKNFDFKGLPEDKLDDMLKVYMEKYTKLNQTSFSNIKAAREAMGKPLTVKDYNLLQLRQVSAGNMAQEQVQNFVKNYQKIGEVLGKGYMTAITVADTFGEAKYEAGASDEEAALLTIGYAIAEAILLNSDLGSWIMPELKNNKLKNQAIVKAFANVPEKLRTNGAKLTGKASKQKIAKHWIKKGMDAAREVIEKGGVKGALAQIGMHGAAEGFEEVSEELLADFSKQCFNTVQWLGGSDKRITSVWQNMGDRYLMSLLGGFVGGGLTSAGTSFKMANTNYTSEQATQELIYMLRQNKKEELYKALDSVTLANPYLKNSSVVQYDGTYVQEAATKYEDSVDASVKKIIKQNIDMLDDMLKAEGLKISDSEFLNIQTLKDLRMSVLQNSPISSSYIQDFNSLSVRILDLQNQINEITSKKGDQKSDQLSEDDEKHIKELKEKLKPLIEKKEAYLNGDYALDFISKSLLALTPEISQYLTTPFFKDWVQQRLNRSVESLSSKELEEQRKEFDLWKATEFKDKISDLAPFLLSISRNSKDFIQEYATNYDTIRRNKSIQSIIKIKEEGSLKNQIQLDQNGNPTEEWGETFKINYSTEVGNILYTLLTSKDSSLANQLRELPEELGAVQLFNTFSKSPNKYLNEFIKSGLINPEIKTSIKNIIEDSINWLKGYQKPVFGLISEFVEDFGDFNIEEEHLSIATRATLSELFETDINTYNDLITLDNIIKRRIANLESIKSQIDKITYTDAIKFIQNILQKNSDTKLDIVKLFDTVNNLLRQSQLEEINFSEIIDQIHEGINIINIMKALVLAARQDESVSIGNLVGYNITLNELAKQYEKEWEELPTIDSNSADVILQDLSLLESKLIDARSIYYLNEGKKLIIHEKIATNKAIITYKRLQKLVQNVNDDDLVGELRKALDEAETLQKLDTTILSEEQKKKVELEIVKIEDAIYDLFNSKDPSKYSILFKDFNFYDIKPQAILENTKVLNDRNFLSYLASRAAIKRSAFNNELRQVIDSEKGLAPISVQEEAVFQEIAEVLNGNKTTEIYNIFKQEAIQDFKNKESDEDKRAALKQMGVSNIVVEQVFREGIESIPFVHEFDNIHLTEGDPGAGKSTGVKYYTFKILDKFHKDCLKNLWLAHGDVKRAEDLSKELEIKPNKLLDHDSLMKLVYSAYNSEREINQYGNYVYDESEIIWDGTKHSFKGEPDAVTEVPSLIVIDEISLYDYFELELLNKFAKQHGITILVSGDFNQSQKLSEFTISGKDYSVASDRLSFKKSPVIGVSMRTGNIQLDKSINAFKIARNNNFKEGFNTYYYQDSEIGLNGIRQFGNSKSEELDQVIDLLVNTSGNEEIGLIYYSDRSEIVEKLQKKYPGKFKPLKGNSAQGLEGKYYIVDFDGVDSSYEGIDNDFYTAITRAQKGVVLIKPGTALGGITVTSIEEFITTNTISPKKGYQNYSKNRKKILDETNNTQELIKEIKRTNSVSITQVKPVPSSTPIIGVLPDKFDGSLFGGVPVSFTYENKTYLTDGKIVTLNDKLVEDQNIIDMISDMYRNYSYEGGESTVITESKQPIVVNITEVPKENQSNNVDNLDYYTYLLYSHNTFELGVGFEEVQDDKGNKHRKLVFLDSDVERYKYRFDSVNGLLKLFNIDPNSDIYLDDFIALIAAIRNAVFSISDKNELVSRINSILTNTKAAKSLGSIKTEIESINFGMVSSPGIGKGNNWGNEKANQGRYLAFDRHKDEKTINNGNINGVSINRKTLDIVITFKNGKKLDLPLYVLNNLGTFIGNTNDPIQKRLSEIRAKHGKSGYKFHKEVLEDPLLNKIPFIVNIAKLFTFTQGGYFNIDDSSWTPAKNLRNWGMQINTLSYGGGYASYDGTNSFTPITQFTNIEGYSFSKKIYTSLEPIYDLNNVAYWVGQKGHPFILVSQDPKITTDEQMQKQYSKQTIDPLEQKKVLRIYIMPPKVDIATYLDNLFKLTNIKSKNDLGKIKKLGSHLTSYYIWKALIPRLDDTFFNTLSNSVKSIIKEKIEELSGIEGNELVSRIMSTVEINGVKQSLVRHLNKFLVSIITDLNGQLIPDNLSRLAQIVEEAGISEIHYSTKFELKTSKSDDQTYVPLEQDSNGSYTIEGLPFLINAKIDSSLFSSNRVFDNIIESWVNKINTSSAVPTSNDTEMYVGKPSGSSSSSIISTKEEIKGTLLNKYKLKNEYVTNDMVSRLHQSQAINYEDVLSQILQEYCNKINNSDNNIIAYSLANNPNQILHSNLSDNIVIPNNLYSLKTNGTNPEIIVEFENNRLIIDTENNNVKVEKIPIGPSEQGIDYANQPIQQGNPVYDLLVAADPLKINKFEGKTLEEIKQDAKIRNGLIRILKQNPELESQPVVQKISEYLKDPSQNCIIIVK